MVNKRNWDEFNLNNGVVSAINLLGYFIHEWAKEKGFWEGKQNDNEKIMLMVTELSEAVEALRHNNLISPILNTLSSKDIDGKLYYPHGSISCVEEELADCVIRIMDYCAFKNFNLGKAIIEKMKYNETREHKHGKQF